MVVIGNPLLKTGRHRHKLGRQSVSGLIKVSLFGKTRSCSILSLVSTDVVMRTPIFKETYTLCQNRQMRNSVLLLL